MSAKVNKMFPVYRFILINLLCFSSTIISESISHQQRLNTPEIIRSYTREWVDYNFLLYEKHPLMTIAKDNIYMYGDFDCHPEDRSRINSRIYYEIMNNSESVSVKKCDYELNVLAGQPIDLPVLLSRAGMKVLIKYVDILETKNANFGVYFLQYRTIDMSTCKYTEIKRSIKVESTSNKSDDYFMRWNMNTNPEIVQFNDGSYEMFILGLDLCNAARCRQKVNVNGTIDDKVVPYVSEKYWFKPMIFYQTNSPHKYFVIIHNDTSSYQLIKQDINLTLLYAWPGGEVKELLNLVEEGEGFYDFDGLENYLTACWSKQLNNTKISNLTCVQYDSNGKQIVNETIVLHHSLSALRVTNLKNGGFLLLTQECKSVMIEYNKCMGDNVFHVRHQQLGWKIGPSLEIEGFDVKYKLNEKLEDIKLLPFISYEDDKNICISLLLKVQKREERLRRIDKFTKKCFSASFVMSHYENEK